ncbi:ImmA/IrrE family metallo-endopeptidase [Streptomyces sp. NPDC049954]|uniref:ImmA/IrrE family metallo-endopeptidase n=1 Tax=Streptomyces sp. NPDC049954 TaxID=3155779 RepID=UPI003445A87E
MSWSDAHGTAMIAAAQAHEQLAVPWDDGYIDVFKALYAEELEVIGKPLGGLLGLYVDAADGGPACLLNTGLDEVNMRHTAAHELGHHRLGHGTSYDHQEQAVGRWGEGWAQEEKDAEAFASWFLIPRPAARAALARCGLDRPRTPQEVYRMARWLGAPYATTVRHLVRLKMISRATESLWLRSSPGTLKAALVGDLPLAPRAHVHVLTLAAHRATVHAQPGDCLLLNIPSSHFDHVPTGLTSTPPDVAGQLLMPGPDDDSSPVRAVWVDEELEDPGTLSAAVPGSPAPFTVRVQRAPDRRGSDHYRR